MSIPDVVARYVGRRPQRLVGHGTCSVWRGAGLVAKVGPGARAEAHVLSGRVGSMPLTTPELVAEGDSWIVMRDLGDDARPWTEHDLFLLLDDLAALHNRFQGAITAGPLRVGARALIARHASFGAWRRVELPGALAEMLDYPEPLFAILDSQTSTLVHGDAYPGNVIRGAGPRRVWIDWEDALIGSAAIDLAAFYGSGPWFLGRSLDRERCLARYGDSLRVPTFDLERSFDAAVVLWTVSQDLGALKKERGRQALEAFVQERVDALDRLAL